MSNQEKEIVKEKLLTDPDQFPEDFTFEDVVGVVKYSAAEDGDFELFMTCCELEEVPLCERG